MAACCMTMIDAASSGVIYTVDPSGMSGNSGSILINAAWGLGAAVVEGRTDADFYRVSRNMDAPEVEARAGRKEFMTVATEGGGTGTVKTGGVRPYGLCLSREAALELAALALRIERHFGGPQDIEWARDASGKFHILQARPLAIRRDSGAASVPLAQPDELHGLLMRGKGVAVQKGTGRGRVYVLRHMEDLASFPKGAVLVARFDSSGFARVMPMVSAIVTDTGTPTSHMASLCREFRIPTIVNAGDATKTLEHGREVTVAVGDDGETAVYDGLVSHPEESAGINSAAPEELHEFRKKRYILRYIAPLNLIDPLIDEFTPERCKTMHDILRYVHEKSVMELVDMARGGTSMLKKRGAVKLDLPIPADIIVIDIGGGLNLAGDVEKATLSQVSSIPLRALLNGMTYPGVWHSEAVSLRMNDFMSSMIRMPDITASAGFAGCNVAVASGDYVNLSLKFGYHYNMIDALCSENARNNHIYFRFVGGATDITKRSRRIRLLAGILKEFSFNISTRGDLIIARLSNIRRQDMENILDQAGRLISYARQLDALLHDDADVERFVKSFISGDYTLQ